ncbi:hypothetical protein M1555_00430 [Patescibacteria group bacterium]|nr:hypothetical protein [Patescibacteria group bacterium]
MRSLALIVISTFVFLFSCFFVSRVYASDYVLPYPSYMPGNRLYRVSRILDGLKRYWYWGTIASIEYRMNLSDKYLVEAKTLFEYKQYLLATDALKRSDSEISYLPGLVSRGRSGGKDMGVFRTSIAEEASVHEEVLRNLLTGVPPEFEWAPENGKVSVLPLGKLLEQSIVLRMRIRSQVKKS